MEVNEQAIPVRMPCMLGNSHDSMLEKSSCIWVMNVVASQQLYKQVSEWRLSCQVQVKVIGVAP